MKAPARLFLTLSAILFCSSSLLCQQSRYEEVRQLIQTGRAQEALGVLETFVSRQSDDAEGLMLRSTARFLIGETAAGRKDLERSLELDPTQRQGWLNLAGLEIAEKSYDDALEALRQAERLDPAASDNDLNLGAVHLRLGDLDQAKSRLDSYLRRERSAEAFYMVAVNYDGSGHRRLALAHLERAIEMDERLRVEAANDERFTDRVEDSAFLTLVTTDRHRLAADSHRAAKIFGNLPYSPDGVLLKAVLQTLQVSGRPLDPRVQVQVDWALMWSDARIKIRQLADGRGRVEMTAPKEEFTPESWKQYSESFFQDVSARLLILEVKQIKQESGG